MRIIVKTVATVRVSENCVHLGVEHRFKTLLTPEAANISPAGDYVIPVDEAPAPVPIGRYRDEIGLLENATANFLSVRHPDDGTEFTPDHAEILRQYLTAQGFNSC